MIKHYLLLATKVLLRRKFFTFISLFGISFTLLVLTVAAALLDHQFAPAAPETRQARTLQLDSADMRGPGHQMCCSPGFALLDRYARDLPGVERLSLFTQGGTVYSYVGGKKVAAWMKRTDGEFWRILDFTFLEGAPYSTQDLEDAAFVAVINDTTRRNAFGDQPGLGRTLDVTGQTFRVVGVVADVPENRSVPFADIWVPYTTTKSDAYKAGLIGGFRAIALANDQARLETIRQEFNSRMARVELDDPRVFTGLVAPFETKFDAFARRSFLADTSSPDSQGWKVMWLFIAAGLMFALLPTVNLVNISISRILERRSEIGVRKAFGASSTTLVGQFIVENVLLTTVGGLLGLMLSAVVLRAFNVSGFIKYAHLAVNLRVFVYGLALAFGFALLSGVYPAWRMSRLHPAAALKGGDGR